MSSSLRFTAKGDICASLRRPSRNLMSCQCVKKIGWPASDGVPGIVALPSGPWQAAHGSALRRPASRSAANTRTLPAARVATSSAVVKTRRISLLRVADAVDRARVVVGDQQRAVLHLARVDRTAPDLVALQPALGEDLVLGHVGRPEGDHHHAEAGLLRAVPGPALGQE